MDISQAKVCVRIGAGVAFNTDKSRNIKDIRANAEGVIEINDTNGNVTQFDALKGEKLGVQGGIEITSTTAVDYQVYL